MKSATLYSTILLTSLLWTSYSFRDSITIGELSSAKRLLFGPKPLQEELASAYVKDAALLPRYLVDIPDYTATRLTLHSSEVNCQNVTQLPPLNTTNNPIGMYTAEGDVWVCLPASFEPVSCSQLWIALGKCSTRMEVHRPFNQTPIVVLPIDQYGELDQSPANMPLAGLCAGTYHLWLVESSRTGSILLGVTAFYIFQPSC